MYVAVSSWTYKCLLSRSAKYKDATCLSQNGYGYIYFFFAARAELGIAWSTYIYIDIIVYTQGLAWHQSFAKPADPDRPRRAMDAEM